MKKFTYNDAKYASTEYTLFELNCRYHPSIFYKEDVNPNSKSKVADELTIKLRDLIATYRKNLQYTQELQKRAHNKGTKPKNYARNKKV